MMKNAGFTVLLGALLQVGCRRPELPGATASSTPEVQNFTNVDDLRRVLIEVGQQVAGPVRFLKMSAGKSYFEIEVQDPHRPDQIDTFERSLSSHGQLRKIPMKTSGASAADLSAASIPLQDVKLEALPELLKQLKQQSTEVANPRPPHFLIVRAPGGRPTWTLFQEGDRKNAELEATLDGKILKWEVR